MEKQITEKIQRKNGNVIRELIYIYDKIGKAENRLLFVF